MLSDNEMKTKIISFKAQHNFSLEGAIIGEEKSLWKMKSKAIGCELPFVKQSSAKFEWSSVEKESAE